MRRQKSSDTSPNREIQRKSRRKSIISVRQNKYAESNSPNPPNIAFVSKTDRIKYVNTHTPTSDEKKLHLEFLQLLIRRTWHLYRLSPVNNLSYTPVKLKQYAARIKQALVRKIQDSTSNISFNATVTVIPETNENETEAKSLKIEVTQQKDNSEPHLKYRGLLLHCEDQIESRNDLSHLPLLLCAGSVTIIRIVHSTIQELFDTVIRSFTISQEDIMWLSLLSDFSYRNKNKKVVQFNFAIPYQSTKNLIKVSFPVDALQVIWNNIHSQDSEEILFDEKDQFYNILNEELSLLFSTNFKMLQLHEIVTPDVTIQSIGKVKFHSEGGVVRILGFLQNIAVLLNDPCPTMGVRFEQ